MSIVAIAGNGITLTSAFGLPVHHHVVIVLRFGLLAFIVMNFVLPLLDHTPLTFDPGLWYAGQSWLALAICAALALFGVRTAVAAAVVLTVRW